MSDDDWTDTYSGNQPEFMGTTQHGHNIWGGHTVSGQRRLAVQAPFAWRLGSEVDECAGKMVDGFVADRLEVERWLFVEPRAPRFGKVDPHENATTYSLRWERGLEAEMKPTQERQQAHHYRQHRAMHSPRNSDRNSHPCRECLDAILFFYEHSLERIYEEATKYAIGFGFDEHHIHQLIESLPLFTDKYEPETRCAWCYKPTTDPVRFGDKIVYCGCKD